MSRREREHRPGWINLQVKHCPKCRRDYPLEKDRCPRCGKALIDKTVRVEAEEV